MIATRIIWHHSAYAPLGAQFDLINKWHKDRGFPLSSLGFYVGYHYVVEADGTVRTARVETEIGAHDQGENANSIGICLAGDFTTNKPTTAQEYAFAVLLTDIMHRLNIPLTRIEPHRRDDDTECPGQSMPDSWPCAMLLKHTPDPVKRSFLLLGFHLGLL